MTLMRTARALALSWYLSIGFGLPLVDAVIFHHDADPHLVHVEDVNNDCHRQACPLEAPGAPQAPASGPEDLARFDRLPTESLAIPRAPGAAAHDAAQSRRARAPPFLT